MGPADVGPDTRLVVTAATYFKAEWETRFDPKKTKPGTFTSAKGDKREVPFMRHKFDSEKDGSRHKIDEDATFAIVELPYKGRELALDLVVPLGEHDLASIEKTLTIEKLETELASLESGETDLALPRFSFSSRVELAKHLEELGMTDAFSAKADFSGIDGKKGTALSKVVHEAWIEVNEEGTEAAAATAAALTFGGPIEVKVDRPFLFLIRDTRTGSILFLGRVHDLGN